MQVIKKIPWRFLLLMYFFKWSLLEKMKWKRVYIPSGRNNIKKKQVYSFVFTYLLIYLFWYCRVVSILKGIDKAKEIPELELHVCSCKENVFLLCCLWPVSFNYCPVIKHLIGKLFIAEMFFTGAELSTRLQKIPLDGWVVHTAHLSYHLHLPPKIFSENML